MKSEKIPNKTQVLVIGGGPAGSLTATLLAQEGIDVIVCEKDKFPRYHIGESLIPSMLAVLDYVGLRKEIDEYGFIQKKGALFKIKKDLPASYTNFRKSERYKYSYQVIRSEFDQLLLNFAKKQGAHVFEETRITEVVFKENKPISAHYERADKTTGTIEFDYVVDASGLSGLFAIRYLKNRQFQPAFANIALCRYWKNFKDYKDDIGREYPGEFLANALSDGSGWVWAIPLHDGTISIGVVIQEVEFKKLKESNLTDDQIYTMKLNLAAETQKLLDGATATGDTKFWNDYSYFAKHFAEDNIRLVGDAAAFLDPLLSSGVHLATMGALSAAASLLAVIRGECTPKEAAQFHDSNVRSMYTRYMLLVSAVYQQITNQKDVVLHGVQGKDLQQVFDIIQPMMTGNLDIAQEQKVSQGDTNRVRSYIQSLWAERSVADHPNAQAVAFKQEGRTSFTAEFGQRDLRADKSSAVEGFFIRLERGKLGLERV